MRTKISLLVLSFASIAIFAAVTIVVLDDGPSSEELANSNAIPESPGSPATAPAKVDHEAEEPAPQESSIDARLLRYVDAGYVNEEFLDYAEMGDRDARFQERFFVLRRSTTPGAENCFKISLDDQTHTCWDDYAYDPYFAYDEATLRQLADGDAVAATVLAIRLEADNTDESLYFRFRATALSGKPGPLVAYLRTHSSQLDVDTHELVNVEDALELYAIALVIDAMGYPYRPVAAQQALLERYGVPAELQEQAVTNALQLLAQLGEST
ncbi:MAG: hypothetical protein O7C67_15045 [Gammaproteobacteria bacterium]|nr:hypothetical protein [Gammaproteobacteria bacterium]